MSESNMSQLEPSLANGISPRWRGWGKIGKKVWENKEEIYYEMSNFLSGVYSKLEHHKRPTRPTRPTKEFVLPDAVEFIVATLP